MIWSARLLNQPQWWQALLLACAAVCSPPARAEEAPPGSDVTLSRAPPEASQAPVTRTWLLNDESRVPDRGQAVVGTRFSYSGGTSVSRPFASNLPLQNQAVELGGEVGLGHGLSLQASGVKAEAPSSAGGVALPEQTGAMLGLRFSVLPRSLQNTHLVISAGYLHDLSNKNGAWARATFGQDLGPARLTASLHGEHVFFAGNDKLDLMVTAGATCRVWQSLRLGLEYVGQDLEESFGDGAEGGARHVLGPVLSATLLRDRLSLVAGPAFALGAQASRALVRAGVAYSF